MPRTRLIIHYRGQDVSDDIELKDGKANPFGWSQYRLVHLRQHGMVTVEHPVGWLYCGKPQLEDADYSFEMVDEEFGGDI